MSPLRDVSDLARITVNLKEDNFISCPSRDSELEQFWSHIDELATSTSDGVLLAPVLSLPQSSPPLSKMYGTVANTVASNDLCMIIVYYQDRQINVPCTSECTNTCMIHYLLLMTFRQFSR